MVSRLLFSVKEYYIYIIYYSVSVLPTTKNVHFAKEYATLVAMRGHPVALRIW